MSKMAAEYRDRSSMDGCLGRKAGILTDSGGLWLQVKGESRLKACSRGGAEAQRKTNEPKA